VYYWEAGHREPYEPVRRLILFLDALPEKQAHRFLTKFEEYGARE